MLAYKISACEVCIIWWKPTEAFKNQSPIAESMTGKPAMATLKIQLDCSTVHYTTLWANIFVRSHLECEQTLFPSVFLRVSLIFQRHKSDANKQDFKIKLNLTCPFNQPTNNRDLNQVILCTSGLNLVVLAWTSDELLSGQAQNGINFDFEVKFDLEGQGQSPQKTIGNLTKVFYTYGPNLVILAWTGDELLHRQTWWRSDGRMQATTIPGGQCWPLVKTRLFHGPWCDI